MSLTQIFVPPLVAHSFLQAKENAENMYDQHYVRGQGADQYDPNQYGAPDRFNY